MENKNAINQKNVPEAAALDCTFTRVVRNSRPALLACITVPIVSQSACQVVLAQLPAQNLANQPDASQPDVSQLGARESTSNRLQKLLEHAANLNARLPLLRASVKARPDDLPAEGAFSPYVFVLHGLFGKRITPQNISCFLDLLVQDFNTFVAYSKAQDIEIMPAGDRSKIVSILAR